MNHTPYPNLKSLFIETLTNYSLTSVKTSFKRETGTKDTTFVNLCFNHKIGFNHFRNRLMKNNIRHMSKSIYIVFQRNM